MQAIIYILIYFSFVLLLITIVIVASSTLRRIIVRRKIKYLLNEYKDHLNVYSENQILEKIKNIENLKSVEEIVVTEINKKRILDFTHYRNLSIYFDLIFVEDCDYDDSLIDLFKFYKSLHKSYSPNLENTASEISEKKG